MKCPGCGFDNKPDKRFCTKCGARLLLHCPKCNSEVEEVDDFCGQCGHDLRKPTEAVPIDYSQPHSYTPKFLAEKILTTRSSIEGERKLVTVLFADVADYTSIAEKLDPEEVHQIMDGCFKILMDEIHRYEGTINQFTGDGVMALFGAPVAHEDHAQRACHAALSIQKAIRGYGEEIRGQCGAEFKMRIGMNSGPVVVGSIGDDLRMDYTAVGDTTNLADRMEKLAKPGGIVVSRNTQRLCRDFFRFESLGKVHVKGKAELQEIFELVGTGRIETRLEASLARGRTRFVGREKERELLMRLWGRARAGFGQVVGIVGEPGVGKSRLLQEFRNSIPHQEYTYLEGRCQHYGASIAYMPVLDILRTYFTVNEQDTEESIKQKLREKLRDLNQGIKETPPALHDVLSLTVEDERYAQLEPKLKRERTLEAIREVLVRGSEKRPLILAVEDLHWIDKSSQDFLDSLIGSLPTARILLLLLFRPEHMHPWGNQGHFTQVDLGPLTADRSAELVAIILEGGEVAQEIRDLVFRRSGGNPLFVEELTHSLLKDGGIESVDGRYVLSRKPTEIHVPDSLQGIIAARLDRLEENLKEILQQASVIGPKFGLRILQAITGGSQNLEDSLVNLQKLEFICKQQTFPEPEYAFKHALSQEVAYDSLLRKRRREIHRRIGLAIEEVCADRLEEYYGLLAYHYVRSDDKEKALHYLGLANHKAAQACAMEDAYSYFDQAIKLLDEMPATPEILDRRISLLVDQSHVFEMLLRFTEYRELLLAHGRLISPAVPPGLKAAYYARLGICEFAAGNFNNGIEMGETARAQGDPEGIVEGSVAAAWCLFATGNFERALSRVDQAIKAIKKSFKFHQYFRSRGNEVASWACAWLGRWEESLARAREVLRIAEEYGSESWISSGHFHLSIAHCERGDLDEAIRQGRLAIEHAPTPADKLWNQSVLGVPLCRSGEWDTAIEIGEFALPLFRAAPFMLGALYAAPVLGEAYFRAGRHEDARRTLLESLQMCERHGARPFEGWTYRLLGELCAHTDPTEAEGHFTRSVKILESVKAENHLALALAAHGRCKRLQGDVATARAYLGSALSIFERLGTLNEPDQVRKELEELDRAA